VISKCTSRIKDVKQAHFKEGRIDELLNRALRRHIHIFLGTEMDLSIYFGAKEEPTMGDSCVVLDSNLKSSAQPESPDKIKKKLFTGKLSLFKKHKTSEQPLAQVPSSPGIPK